jgi:hypothetical protein
MQDGSALVEGVTPVGFGGIQKVSEATDRRLHVIAAEHRITFAVFPPIVHLLSAENADGRSGFPKNVLDSTLPVVLSLVVIVLMFPLTETSTISSSEI